MIPTSLSKTNVGLHRVRAAERPVHKSLGIGRSAANTSLAKKYQT